MAVGAGMARTNPERERTIAGRFRALPARQRMLLGLFGVIFSSFGLAFSDRLERKHLERESLQHSSRGKKEN